MTDGPVDPQLRFAHALLDALIGFDTDLDDGTNVAAVSLALERASAIASELDVSVTLGGGQPPSINLSKLISASLLPTIVLIDRVAELEDTDRDQVVAELREELDRVYGED